MTEKLDRQVETLRYYNTYGQLTWKESRRNLDATALHGFVGALKGDRVLDAGCGPGCALTWFVAQGLKTEGFDASPQLIEMARASKATVAVKDFRLLSLSKETYDGIWCDRALPHLPIEEAQRALASFFQSLKPAQGVLFLSYISGTGILEDRGPGQELRSFYRYTDPALHSLLRQTGFNVSLSAERQEEGETWKAVVARRA